MKILRTTLFTVSFYLLTTVFALLYLPLLLLPRSKFAPFVRFWIRTILFCAKIFLGIRHHVKGLRYMPDYPVIFACKHQSLWETLFINLIVHDIAFIAKKELIAIPLFGLYMKKMGHIVVDRSDGARAIKKLHLDSQQVFAAGRSILIFPEGTRVSPSNPELDTAPNGKHYKSGIAFLYAKINCPIVPIALNSGLFWPKGQFTKNAGVITLEFLPVIEAGLSRQAIMQKLETVIETATISLEKEAVARYPETQKFH